MSVDFFPTRPGTLLRFPVIRSAGRPCQACASGWCQPGWCEDGIEYDEQPSATEANFSNDNARALLLAVGLGSELCGALAADEIDDVAVECVVAMRSNAEGMVARSGMLRAAERTSNTVMLAATDDDARARLGRFLAVLRWALEHGAGIAWS